MTLRGFNLLFLSISLFSSSYIKAVNSPIEVTSKTFKLGINEEVFYFAFAAGDEIVLNFEILDGKPAKEVEVIEMPGSSKFMEWKTKAIKDKKIKVQQKAIYKFRFRNGGLGRKICRVHIQRIPADQSTIDFNTSVVWKTRYDTTWIDKVRKELVKVDTHVVEQVDRVERVHSQTNLENSNVSSFVVRLPKNEIAELKTKKVISWAWWVGVGDAGTAAYNSAQKEFLRKNASKVATLINPLAGLAVGAYAIAMNPPEGDNIHYEMKAFYRNGNEYTICSGNSVVGYGREDKVLQGSFSVLLENDNLMNGINVNVKITIVMESRTYKEVAYQEPDVAETQYVDFAE